ncbi:hypothetical protein LguiB_004069 [Lonicera macranthoides]
MGFNEVNFGWGKPVWVSQKGSNNIMSAYKSGATLMEGDTPDKIELWLILDHREMLGCCVRDGRERAGKKKKKKKENYDSVAIKNEIFDWPVFSAMSSAISPELLMDLFYR